MGLHMQARGSASFDGSLAYSIPPSTRIRLAPKSCAGSPQEIHSTFLPHLRLQAGGVMVVEPTLDRGGPRHSWPRPPCAFDLSMLIVPCNSHADAHFAAFFIDPRAK